MGHIASPYGYFSLSGALSGITPIYSVWGEGIFVWGVIFWYLCGSYSVLGLVSGAERWHTPTGYHIEIGF